MPSFTHMAEEKHGVLKGSQVALSTLHPRSSALLHYQHCTFPPRHRAFLPLSMQFSTLISATLILLSASHLSEAAVPFTCKHGVLPRKEWSALSRTERAAYM